jgi:hypothetical protein
LQQRYKKIIVYISLNHHQALQHWDKRDIEYFISRIATINIDKKKFLIFFFSKTSWPRLVELGDLDKHWDITSAREFFISNIKFTKINIKKTGN